MFTAHVSAINNFLRYFFSPILDKLCSTYFLLKRHIYFQCVKAPSLKTTDIYILYSIHIMWYP